MEKKSNDSKVKFTPIDGDTIDVAGELWVRKSKLKLVFTDFKTFSDLCCAVGTTEEEFNRKWDPDVFDPSTIAFERIKICNRAYNQEWRANTYDTTQKKWFPYFMVLSSGLGFSSSLYFYDSTDAYVGSRLCFESREKSDHAGKTFIKLFEDFITAQN